MGSSLSKRTASENEQETRLVVKKARYESWGDADVVVAVGEQEFQECSRFLRCWSGFFEDELAKGLTRFEFPEKKASEWELIKAVLHPFAEESVNTSNYHVLLPWFAELRCEAGLSETDTVILKDIVDPLLDKPEKERQPADVEEIVTVLEHCVDWKRENPRGRCITFLRQILKDPTQPFEGKEILRMVLLLVKDDVCQKALWKFVKYYLPAELVESTTFPAGQVSLVADNPLLLDVIEANMKLKKCLYLVELKLKQVVATQKNETEADKEEKTAAAVETEPKKKTAEPESEKKARKINPYKKQPAAKSVDAPAGDKKPAALSVPDKKKKKKQAEEAADKKKKAAEEPDCVVLVEV
ncbi:expressed unknown protein [Seminavis robusta]|uniref:Uncharacterized protein n=1 Tax=Seminavis robusta TaxID=568900 RepID=A0A9N8EXZ9_9STRA|nr:expressed unknown protein [Seminavis robusta]|eukprot:Sro2221_g319650.1 n/a (356) ;mRNA; r:15135-16202